MKKYPYQNFEIKNIKGERWKDIPGLEFYFNVSNYGRIKRLEYELDYSDGRKYLKQEKIIKPVVMQVSNNFMNDYILFLRTSVTLFKQKHNFSVARLVYNCFVQTFNMNDSSIVILTKDGNGLNIKPSNLIKAAISDKQKRIFDLDRHAPLVVGPEARQRSIAHAKRRNNKQVTQYDLKGKRIKTYPSATEAAKQTGISPGHISARARGTEFSAGGFIWKYGNAGRFDLSPIIKKIEEKRARNKKDFGKKVTQYNMKGDRIANFPTINDASKLTGIKHSAISQVVNHKAQSAGGFYWREGYGRKKIDMSNHLHGQALITQKRQRAVKQFSIAGKYLGQFESIKEAARFAGVHSTTIVGMLSGKYNTAGGSIWEYVSL